MRWRRQRPAGQDWSVPAWFGGRPLKVPLAVLDPAMLAAADDAGRLEEAQKEAGEAERH